MNRFVKFATAFTLLCLLAFPHNIHAQGNLLQCGDIVEGEFTSANQTIEYSINLVPRDVIRVSGTVVGDFLQFDIEIRSPSGTRVAGMLGSNSISSAPSVESGVLGERGIHDLLIRNNGSFGIYTLFIGCVLGDGTVIEPGDALAEESDLASQTDTETSDEDTTGFVGFGFPGVASRDFSAGIEIPITRGQPQTVPLASDVVLYTYSATANEVATLRLSRISGDISVGVSVIRRESNEIVFVGGMPSSNNLAVELTFPTAGPYVIGLFRLDTIERTDTSGAVQVSIE